MRRVNRVCCCVGQRGWERGVVLHEMVGSNKRWRDGGGSGKGLGLTQSNLKRWGLGGVGGEAPSCTFFDASSQHFPRAPPRTRSPSCPLLPPKPHLPSNRLPPQPHRPTLAITHPLISLSPGWKPPRPPSTTAAPPQAPFSTRHHSTSPSRPPNTPPLRRPRPPAAPAPRVAGPLLRPEACLQGGASRQGFRARCSRWRVGPRPPPPPVRRRTLPSTPVAPGGGAFS